MFNSNYNESDDVESLLDKGWITFQNAYGNLFENESFVAIIRNDLKKFLFEQITPQLKKEIEWSLKTIIMTHLRETKLDYELKIAAYRYDPSCIVVLARKLLK